MQGNKLFYGDNLEVLALHFDPETVDLIYLDPPFKSDQNYNILFTEQDGSRSAAQIKAFEDTWRWDQSAAAAYQRIVEDGGDLSEAMQGFRRLLGDNDMLAYLAMMAPRLAQLARVLKSTGSIYLHCDPTASHYLKILMDAVFHPKNFRSEIIWRRTGSHSKSRRYAPIHDSILFYTKSGEYKWNSQKKPYMKGHVEEHFERDAHGWHTNYYGNVLTGSGIRGGESGKPWKGIDPTPKGRHWAIPKALLDEADEDFSGLSQHQKLDRLFELGFIKITEGHAWPMYEHYLKPEAGQNVPDIWAFQPYTSGTVFGSDEGIDEDVRWLPPKDQERLGYPTQKPESLLERIIRASSDEGDVVLDPFCGCGTAVSVAQHLNRAWYGIDITHLAITLIKHRLRTRYNDAVKYDVIGEPASVKDAEALAKADPYQFQLWALGLVRARPAELKKGSDKGIDGRLYFHDEGVKGQTKQIVISVKGGGVSVTDVRDLRGVIEREDAEIGVLISMRDSTKPMRTEAADAGYYTHEWSGEKYLRIQLLTIAELFEGKTIGYPQYLSNVTFKPAKRAKSKSAKTLPLPE